MIVVNVEKSDEKPSAPSIMLEFSLTELHILDRAVALIGFNKVGELMDTTYRGHIEAEMMPMSTKLNELARIHPLADYKRPWKANNG